MTEKALLNYVDLNARKELEGCGSQESYNQCRYILGRHQVRFVSLSYCFSRRYFFTQVLFL